MFHERRQDIQFVAFGCACLGIEKLLDCS